MGALLEGKWVSRPFDTDERGRFVRQRSTFRDWVKDEPGARFTPEPDRYHLYVSYACPWAHRTRIVRDLRGLDEVIGLSVVDYYMGEDGWFFSDAPGATPDTVNHTQYLREIYLMADPHYTGRVTVPVLWDKKEGTIVNNESREIVRMMDTAFARLGRPEVTLLPDGAGVTVDDVDAAIDAIYEPINNGVYRCGFARSQEAYDTAVGELFRALDGWNEVLGEQRYVCGPVLTEADICLFTTLIRFDLVYHTHFKCNVRHIYEYENLWNFMLEIYQLPGVAETCDFEHIKGHYYKSHESVNPRGIVARGPDLDLRQAHDRERLPGSTPRL